MIGTAPAWLPKSRPVLIGVVHLGALPGAPLHAKPLAALVDAALLDARAWEEGGADALIVENFGDVPFFRDAVPPETVACMTAVTARVVDSVSIPIGVNVLRNDGEAALAVAEATGARFIRVNVLTHAAITDQGIVQGIAASLMRKRAALASNVSVFADVLVKHARPLAPLDAGQAAEDAVQRAGADGLIVTGEATGSSTDRYIAETVAAHAGETPVFIGSGVTPESVQHYSDFAAGMIVGTWCKVEDRVSEDRVRRLADRIHGD